MINQDQISQVMSATAHDRSGDKIGRIGQVYLDDQTGAPEWVTVQTGLFGTKETLVPLSGASLEGDRLSVAVEKSQVKDAPQLDEDGHLSQEDEALLYTHYGLEYTEATSDSDLGTTETPDYATTDSGPADDGGYDDVEARPVGHDTSGPSTDDAMTRSEERVSIGTQQVTTGRARLRKYIVTENVTQTVPVSREEIRVEREPITTANAGDAYDGPALSEEEHEVVLHEERAVVQKETVPVERVRLGKETVTEQQTVTTDVRKEEIALENETGRSVTEGDVTRGDLR